MSAHSRQGTFRRPAIRFVAWSLLLHWAWEVAHAPAYVETDMPPLDRIVHCAPMALVDTAWAAVVVLAAHAVVARARERTAVIAAAAAALGAASAAVFEMWAVASGRWTYNDRMPLVPLIGAGLWPVLQMTILPPLALWLSAPRGDRRLLS